MSHSIAYRETRETKDLDLYIVTTSVFELPETAESDYSVHYLTRPVSPAFRNELL